MAQVALGVAGAAIGSFFGPVGASISAKTPFQVGELITPRHGQSSTAFAVTQEVKLEHPQRLHCA